MRSDAKTPEAYLESLPPERRDALNEVRRVVLDHLPAGYIECMQYGMIGYAVPHSLFPAGYHCDPRQPLPFAGLASQKGHMSFYLMSVYGSPEEENRLREGFQRAGKKLDMGKCCIRFRNVSDLALETIGEAIARMSVERYVELYQRTLRAGKTKAASTSKAAKPKSTAPAKAKARAGTARKTKTARAKTPRR